MGWLGAAMALEGSDLRADLFYGEVVSSGQTVRSEIGPYQHAVSPFFYCKTAY
jgi:hypothetical protein